VPEFFKNAPMFKRMRAQAKGKNKQLIRDKAKKARGMLSQFYFILIRLDFVKG